MYSRASKLVCLVLLALACAAVGRAQATAGSVNGTVVDAQGAVIAGATVTLTNKANGVKLTTQTTDVGTYSLPNVPVGDYTITVEQQGFAPATQTLKVLLNQTTTVDATLQAGAVAATVDVTAASEALVQTDTSQNVSSFETRQVQDLPIFGDQNFLALLAPNVVAQAAGVSGEGGAVGGTRPRSNSFNVDGVDNNDSVNTGHQINIIQDAIQQVTILTNNYSAEFGTGSGGQFNTVTRSGTNEYHGSGFLYVQNQHLNAASTGEERLLNLPAGDPDRLTRKPFFKDTRYGGTFGGPIIKNKLFFFGAAQREVIDQAGTSASYLAPTLAGLNQIATLPGASPFVVELLRNNLTLPGAASTTQTVLGTSIPFGTVTIVNPAGSRENQFQINVDHYRGARDQFRYRFSFDRIRQEQTGNGNLAFNNLLAQDTKLFSATWVRTLNTNMVNEARLSYRRFIQDYPLKNPEFGGFGANNFPNIEVDELNLNFGPNGNLPQGNPVLDNYQVYDALSYTRGAHSFKFGGEYRNLIYTNLFLPRGRGEWSYASFDELIRDLAPTNVDLRGVGSPSFSGNQQKWYAFAQDDWKATPNLTLNLGLRSEYLTLPRDARTQGLNALSSVPGVIEFRVPKTDKNNFAPRVGLAYAPEFGGRLHFLSGERGQSSLRASFALSYYETFGNLFLLQLPPQFQTELDVAGANAAFGIDLNTRFLEQGGTPARLPVITNPADARAITQALITDVVEPYNMAWSLSYQRALTPSTAVEFRYLHTAGRRLPVQVRLNGAAVDYSRLRVPTFFSTPTAAQLATLPTIADLGGPRFPRRLAAFGFGSSNLTAFEPEGNSVYDGGSVSLTRRLSKGLAFTSAYTWSKAIDNATNELFSSTVNPRRAQDAFDLREERGLSAVDVPHRFVASFNYDIPWFNRSDSSVVRAVLGGWQLNGVFQAQSGQPVTPQSNTDSNGNRDVAGDRTIVNLAGVRGTGSAVLALDRTGAQVELGEPTTVAYVAVNPNAQYIQAGPFARANAGRNTLRSHGFNRTDVVLVKNTHLWSERYNLQIAAEVYNLFNQRIRTIGDFGNPIFKNQNFNDNAGVGPGTPSFAVVDSPFFNNYSTGTFSGRTVQLRAKFIF